VALTPVEGEPVTGRIVRAGQDEVTLEVPATKKQPARTQDFRYADVSRAVVQVEFSRGRAEDEGDQHDSDSSDEEN
jgi:ribosome maturation factor RimP